MNKSNDARRMALEILMRVEGGAYADLALDAAIQRVPQLDPRERGLLTELVYGVLRRRGRLDFALAGFCQQPFAKIETRLAWILRIAAYQILQLDRIPASAAVNTAVEMTRQIGLERATGFVNGILRALTRAPAIPWPDAATDPLGHLVHALSVPEWLAQRWLAEFGIDEALALAAAMQEAAPFTVRVNTLKVDRERLLEVFTAVGHRVEPCRYSPDGIVVRERGDQPLPGQEDGWFQPQDEASQLISRLLDPQPGERILDACSAPGGKTTHMAALTASQSDLLALDLHPQRLKLVENGAKRLGATGIATRAWDLTTPPHFLAPASFDRVLLDAPCSGLGVLRRNPEIRWQRDASGIHAMADRQRQLLRQVAPLVRPGGTLVYSVCTTTPEETSAIVDEFLGHAVTFVQEDLRLAFPAWQELIDASGALHTCPHRHAGMDAFYAVRLHCRG